MTSSGTLRFLREFWGSFGLLPLYDTGFDDAVTQCGAQRAESHEEALLALSYLRGYTEAAKLACPYMGAHWRIADALVSLTATLILTIRNDTLTAASADRLCRMATWDLAELCREKASPMGRAAGGGA